MENSTMKFTSISLALFVLFCGASVNAETVNHNPELSYERNETVIFDNCIFKAKTFIYSGISPVISKKIHSENPWEMLSCGFAMRKKEINNINEHETIPEYKENTVYQSGDLVFAVGTKNIYECKEGVSSWCSTSAWAYEPGKGTAWSSAWSQLNNSGGEPDSSNPPPPLESGNGSEDHPATTDFDYRNQIVGLTKATVQYNDGGKISGEKATFPSDHIVGGYVSEWSVYGRGFDLERLSGLSYNRLVYAFAGICGDRASGSASDIVRKECQKQNLKENEMVILDPWAGFIKPINERQERMGWDASYDANNPQLIPQSKARGLMGQLLELKKQNTNLKVAISIGGWTMSEPFHRMSADQASRDTFISSVIGFVYKWGLDGVDLDWEFPGHGGVSGKWTEEDGKNFSLLVKDMKMALNALSKVTGKKYEVSSAVGATENYISKIGEHYKLVNEYIDNIYLMNYDYFGAWETKLGHQSNLRNSTALGQDFSIENAIQLLQKNGVDKNKIVLGIANYSRGAKAPLYQSSPLSSGPLNNSLVFGTWENTVVEGYELFPNMAGKGMTGVNGWELRTDKEANADFFYNYNTQIFHSIDTPRTAYVKAKYAKDNGLKGAFVWTVEQDYNGQTVNAMNDAFDHPLTDLYTTRQERTKLYTQCGINLSDAECSSLNTAEISLPEAVIDPEEPLTVKHLHLFNRHILIKKFRVWEGDKLVFESPYGLTAGLGELMTNITIKRNTKIEVMALRMRSEFKADAHLYKTFNQDQMMKLIAAAEKSKSVRITAIDFIGEILGIPTSLADVFLSIIFDVVQISINAFEYQHFGWVDMSKISNANKTEIMIENYGYDKTTVSEYR